MIKDFFTQSKNFFINILNKLSGQDKRSVIAEMADMVGYGGQTLIFN